MEALIEAIIWLLRSLFGEQEKPADMSQTPRRETRRPLGSGQSGSRPKTLEEILEEVRRDAAQRRQGGTPPAQMNPDLEPKPAPAPASAPSPARHKPVVFEEQSPSEERVAEVKTIVAQPSVGEIRAPVSSQRASRERQPVSEAVPPPAWQKKAAARPKPAPARPAAKTVTTEDAPVARLVQLRPLHDTEGALPSAEHKRPAKAREAPPPAADSLDLLRGLRGASGSTKTAVARQAFIFSEVFGRPRALRGWHPIKRTN